MLEAILAKNPAEEKTYIEDVFSTYRYIGNGSRQTIINDIAIGSSYGGSVYLTSSSYFDITAYTPSGDFTFECWVKRTASVSLPSMILSGDNNTELKITNSGDIQLVVQNIGIATSGAGTFNNDTWYHIALTRNGTNYIVYLNGVFLFQGTSSDTFKINRLGQRTSGGDYTFNGYMSNCRIVDGSRVYTTAFTPSTSPLTAVSGTVLLTCQAPDVTKDYSGTNRAITVTGTSSIFAHNGGGPFTDNNANKGGMVWIKNRSAAHNHRVFDTTRTSVLSTNTTGAAGAGYIPSYFDFTSSGFTIPQTITSFINDNNSEYVSWTFRKAKKFFDVVTYTGNGVAGRTINHSLDSIPGMIIIKRTDSTDDWWVYHRSLGSPSSSSLKLNTTDQNTGTGLFLAPTETNFGIDYTSSMFGNANGATYVAYLFAHNAGGFGSTGTDNVISCGSLTQNSGGYATVNLGYEPQYLLLKKTSGTSNWYIFDTMRGWSVVGNPYVLADTNDAQTPGAGVIRPTSTGFETVAWDPNTTYVYMAIRRGPMRTPTDATKLFQVVDNPTSPDVNSSILVDAQIFKWKAGTQGWFWNDRVRRGSGRLDSSTSDSESTGSLPTYLNLDFLQTGTKQLGSSFGSDYLAYHFRRAPGFFDVVAYTGTGSATAINHNLTTIPEMMIVKRRNVDDNWAIYAAPLGNTKYLGFVGNGERTGSIWDNTTPTSTQFFIGSSNSLTNISGGTYIAYLFGSLAGVSKVGSYTGTGTTQQINCGFTNGARFVMIQRTDTDGYGSIVFNSTRGIISGNDPYLAFTSGASEVTNTDYIDPYSPGFEISSTAPAGMNASGGTYVYLAIA